MDKKSAVLHWLHDVEEATSSAIDTALSDSNGGSLNPNTTGRESVSPLGLPYSLHYHSHSHHHDNTLHPPQSLPTSTHGVRSISLVPSSSFQVPEDPGNNKPPEVIRKFLRSNTLSGSRLSHRASQTKVDPAYIEPGGKDDTGVKLTAAAGGGSHEDLVLRKEQSMFPPHRIKHQKHHSWSQIPVPASNPELDQPTIDLANADLTSSKRKTLVKSTLSVSTSIKFSSLDGDPISAIPSTLTRLTVVSPPASAPVSPSREKSCTKLNEVKSLSHSNLANLDSATISSDISNVSSAGSVDGQSHQADRGEFSDAAISDESHRMHFSSSTSSSFQQEMHIKEQEKVETVSSLELMSSLELDQRDQPGAEVPEHAEQIHLQEHSHSSKLELECVKKNVAAEDSREKDDENVRPLNCEEELLGILKKWYYKGYGEKEDLIRALKITGHRKSAYELMKEEEEQKEDDKLPVPDPDTIVKYSACSDNSDPVHDSSLIVPVSLVPHPPVQTALHSTCDPTALIGRHLSPVPSIPQSEAPPEPANLLPLSRKKLAELDKANCFTFDDSSDDILDAKSSNMIAKKNSPLSSKTHSWSLSDYSGSLTSSSSYSAHAISPGVRTGSPTFSKLSGTSDHKLIGSTSPRRHGHGMFTVSVETKEIPHADRHLQSTARPSDTITSARRLKLLALKKSSSLAQDKYTPAFTENKSSVNKRT